VPVIGGRAHNIEQIHEVGKFGYRFAEISLLEPEDVRTQLNELRKLRDQYGMYYLAHYPNEGNPFDLERLGSGFIPKMKQLIDLTKELRIRKGTIHFWMDKRWAPVELITSKIKLLADLVSYANDRDVTICLENLTERYDSFITAFEAIPDLKMTMDIGHGELLSSRNTSFGFTRHVFDRIEHVHVHDNRGGTSVADDLHLALGDGRIDYPAILTILKEKEYSSTITMEVIPADMPRTKAEIDNYIA
jgi:sugar phosphate isomerase/epimerase